MAKERIVVVEDEADICEIITYNLQRRGFQVDVADAGDVGLDLIRKTTPHLVILDLMLPGLGGIDVCRQMRQGDTTAHIPIIMVTAKGEENDIVEGLNAGADDYVTKPFKPRELLARVEAILRRSQPQTAHRPQEQIVCDGITIDAVRHRVLIDGKPTTFTATEFRLLHEMALHAGRVYTRDQLLSRVMGDDVALVDRNIDVHVRRIRQKLGPYRGLVETVHGVGYRFREQE